MGDDAGGSRRGARAEPGADLAAVLVTRYGMDVSATVDLGGLNLNLLVSRHGARFVARVYRPFVTEARLGAIQDVRSTLRDCGVPCAPTVPTNDGAPWARVGERLVEVEPFVAHDARMNTPERLRRGLPLLGRLHAVLDGVDVPAAGREVAYANYIGPAHVLPRTTQGVDRIRSWGPDATLRRLADQADRLAQLVAAAEAGLPARPRQIVHGDFWDNNVFFRGDQPVLVADFDFMAERTRVDDLALTLYFADAAFGHSDTESRADALRPLLKAYESGLTEPLSDAERAALPWAMARQPLWGIGGWVVDLDDDDAARRHALDTAEEVQRWLAAASDMTRWRDSLLS